MDKIKEEEVVVEGEPDKPRTDQTKVDKPFDKTKQRPSGKGDQLRLVTQSTSYPAPTNMQPTLKLELFQPDPKPPQPMGMYNPYLQYIPPGPALNLFGNTLCGPSAEDKLKAKQFSASSFQHLFAPTSSTPIACAPNVKIPMQQVFNISLPGPTGGHVEMNRIYEDILPGGENKLTATTLGERLQTFDYIRQILIKMHEGEEMSLDSNGQNSIMSTIKFMEINPNYYSPIYNNPYKGLPYGLLVYRSCFPIRYDKMSQSIMCAKNSIGLNIRLYALTCAEYYSFKFRQPVYIEYDVWRELAYYEYMRENVLKRKQSPNFPLLYSYFLSPNRKIDFFKLKKNCLTQKDILSLEYKNFEKQHMLLSALTPPEKIIRPMDAAGFAITKLPDEVDPSLQAYSGTTLIIITEVSHHNLYQWASRIYEPDGIVRKMVQHGYHDENVWLNVIFQIVAALHVMQVHGIYMRCMTIEDNVYIKDLLNYGKPLGYWKYIINGISYYLPNYGYIVFLDSNFKDIYPKGTTIDQCKREYKIYTANIFGKKYPMQSIRKKVFENYRNIINTNAFTKEHTQNNVCKPPDSIMKLIGRMMEDPETDLGIVLSKYFHCLMNNRIGTLLRKDSEIPNIREITGSFKDGEMAVQVIEDNLYRWCMVVRTKPDGMVEIITRNNPGACDFSNNKCDFMTTDVRIETLKQYNCAERIEQNTNPNINLSEDDLLETYILTDPNPNC